MGKEALDEWTKSLVVLLNISREGSKLLTDVVAKGTKTVNENWLRIYTANCPEYLSRSAAVQVFAATFKNLIVYQEKRKILKHGLKRGYTS